MTIIGSFDVFSVPPPQIFQVQVKIPAIQPVLPDQFSNSDDYDNIHMENAFNCSKSFKELSGMHNNYPLASDKIEIKIEMLSHVVKYRLLIFAIFLLAILKNWSLTFLIKKSMCFIFKTCNLI